MSIGSALFFKGTLFLAVNQPTSLSINNRELWFSDSKLLSAQARGSNEVLLRPLKEGTLYAYGVKQPEQSSSKDGLRIQILGMQNFKALSRCSEPSLDIEATPMKLTQYLDLKTLKSCDFGELQFSQSLSDLYEAEFESAENKIETIGVKVVSRQTKNGRRFLVVSDTSPNIIEEVKTALGPLSAFYVLSKLKGPKPGRTLVFQINIFEFSRSRAEKLGLKWPQGVTLKSVDNGSALSLSDGTLNLGLDFGESLGVGRILAQPQIRTKPGEKASFQSGGEFPVKVSSGLTSSISWKNYGLLLDIEPDAQVETGASEISIQFKIELSEIDGSIKANDVPGLIVRKLGSRFDLRTNETTVLSTMIQTRSSSTQEGPWGTHQLPLIKYVFGHDTELSQDSELWFSIRPSWEEIAWKKNL